MRQTNYLRINEEHKPSRKEQKGKEEKQKKGKEEKLKEKRKNLQQRGIKK